MPGDYRPTSSWCRAGHAKTADEPAMYEHVIVGALDGATDVVSKIQTLASSGLDADEFSTKLREEHEGLLADDGLGYVGHNGDVVKIRHRADIGPQDRELLLEFADLYLDDSYEFSLVAAD
jgi:hypothetical protein